MAEPRPFDYDVFISYSSKDKTWVRGELLKRIEETGLKAFIDFRDFTRGAPSIQEMERGVVKCRKTLLILTPDYLASEWCEIENIMLLTLSPANRELRLIPLLKADCQKPLRIGALTHIDFTDGADLDLAWRQLLIALGKPPEPNPTKGPQRDPARISRSPNQGTATGSSKLAWFRWKWVLAATVLGVAAASPFLLREERFTGIRGIVYLEGTPVQSAIVKLPEATGPDNTVRIEPEDGGQFAFEGHAELRVPVRLVISFDPSAGLYAVKRDVKPIRSGLTRIELTEKDIRHVESQDLFSLMFGAVPDTESDETSLARSVSDWNHAISDSQMIPIYPLTEDLLPGDVFVVSESPAQESKRFKRLGNVILDQLLVRLSTGLTNATFVSSVALPTYGFSITDTTTRSLGLPFEAIPIGLSLLGTKEAEGLLDFRDAQNYRVATKDALEALRAWASKNASSLAWVTADPGSPKCLRLVSAVTMISAFSVTLSASPDKPGISLAPYANSLDKLNAAIAEQTKGFSIMGAALKVDAATSHSVTIKTQLQRPLAVGYVGWDIVILPGGTFAAPILTADRIGIAK